MRENEMTRERKKPVEAVSEEGETESCAKISLPVFFFFWKRRSKGKREDGCLGGIALALRLLT